MLAETYKDLVSMHRVIIIGAGIAGLAAADKLIEDGITNFKILEARHVAGGRLCSMPYDEDKYLELGAQWIHGERGNHMYSFAQKHYLLDLESAENYEAEGLFTTSEGDAVDSKLVKEIQDICLNAIAVCSELLEKDLSYVPSSIGEILTQHFQRYLDNYNNSRDDIRLKTGIFRWFWNFLCIDNSCYSMNEVSSKTWFEYIDCPGNSRISLKNGFQSVIDRMLQGIPKDTIVLNTPVQQVLWDRPPLTVNLIRTFDPTPLPLPKTSSTPTSKAGRKIMITPREIEEVTDVGDDSNENRKILGLRRIIRHPDTYPVEIICENGDVYLCEHLIVTSSVGCLKQTATDMFYPPLADSKMQAIRTMGFATINKIFLVFETPFWDEDCKGFQFIWIQDEDDFESDRIEDNVSVIVQDGWYADITGFDTMPSHPNVLLGWVGRQGAIDMEILSDEQVINDCMNLLHRFTGNYALPDAIAVYRSAWNSEPYIHGAYSYRTVNSDRENCSYTDLETPIYLSVADLLYPVILFAGEATDQTCYSTVHGAMNSGYREAGRISDFYILIRQKMLQEHEKLMAVTAVDQSEESVKAASGTRVRTKPSRKEKKQQWA